MPLQISIADVDLAGFSAPARDQLRDSLEGYATDLISEANRLEAANRTPADAPDVSAVMVRDASTFVRRGMISKPSSLKERLARVLAAVLALLVGLVWDKNSLQDSTYLILFGVLFIITLITVTIIALKD